MDFSIPPSKLFCFECSYFLQIGKTIRVASEVDVLILEHRVDIGGNTWSISVLSMSCWDWQCSRMAS